MPILFFFKETYMDYLKWAQRAFANDRYAQLSGIEIIGADEHYAKCRMVIDERHLNNLNSVMGGAIFTLADFTFGTAANTPLPNCITLDSSFNFMRATAGPVLYAEARCVKNGRNICFFVVSVMDDEGKLIAEGQFKGFRNVAAG